MIEVAETKGFEPLIQFPVYTLSRRAPSTTRTRLRLYFSEPSIKKLVTHFLPIAIGTPSIPILREHVSVKGQQKYSYKNQLPNKFCALRVV